MMKPTKEEEKSSSYDRLVLKNEAPHHYLKLYLVLEDETTRLTAVEFKQFIITGLKALHGEVGAAINFDVLKYNEETLSAVLRVGSRGLVKLWTSITLLGSYQNQSCAFRVQQVSPYLLALTGNSRDLQLD